MEVLGVISALRTYYSYNLLRSGTWAKVHIKTKCHIIGEDNSSGKKLGTVLSDSVTDLESFLTFCLCQTRRGNLTDEFKLLSAST